MQATAKPPRPLLTADAGLVQSGCPIEFAFFGDDEGVQIPEAFFLIVVDEHEGKLRTLSLIVPQETPAEASLDAFLVSIDEIERRTQLDLLAGLDDATENALEQRIPSNVW